MARAKLDPDVKELKRLFMFDKNHKERIPFLDKKLKRVLPSGLEPELAKRVFERMFFDTYHDPSWSELVVPEYARAALAAYREVKYSFAAHAAWVVAAVNPGADDATLASQLREAIVAMKRLHVPLYAATREGIDATLKDPRWIEATQAAIAATPDEWNWSISMVGLLLADGSASSIDVLIPMATRALKEKGQELDKLRDAAVKFGANTPEVKAFLTRLHAEADDRAEAGGANAFARAISLDAKNTFQFKAVIHGFRKNGSPLFECNVFVDAGDKRWGSMRLVWVGGRRVRHNEWSNEEEKAYTNKPLGKLEKFPAWLQDLAKTRRCTFKLMTVTTNLKGAPAERVKEWLRSAVTPLPASRAT
ncbi:MAG: hypothetical protein QM817_01430 [Archangium sp.]